MVKNNWIIIKKICINQPDLSKRMDFKFKHQLTFIYILATEKKKYQMIFSTEIKQYHSLKLPNISEN